MIITTIAPMMKNNPVKYKRRYAILMNKLIFRGANRLIFPRLFSNENLLRTVVYDASFEIVILFSSRMKIILYLKYFIPVRQIKLNDQSVINITIELFT